MLQENKVKNLKKLAFTIKMQFIENFPWLRFGEKSFF